MKKYFILISFFFVAFNSFASNPIKAFLTFSTFNNPSKGPYVETYLSVIGNSVNFVQGGNGKFQGSVDISIAFTQNNEIKSALKYTLTSPEITDTTKNYPNFLDQHRYNLPNGKYNLEISIADKNKPSDKPFTSTAPVIINYQDSLITVSDIQLLESYTKSNANTLLTKSGYELVPYVSNFYPENINMIKFYTEIYNAKKILGEGQKMIISYSIQAYQTRTKLNDYSAFSMQTTNNVNILLSELSIASLPSGNYNMVVEVKDKDNKVRAVQILPFQRKNKLATLAFTDLKSIDVTHTFVSNMKSLDTLAEYIRSMRPISGSAEVQYAENQLKGQNLEQMQQYFYNFWKTRNSNAPEAAWNDYSAEVKKVNREYGVLGRKGYNTDRGRIYLQYGPPDILGKYEYETNCYPFEIWHYQVLRDKTKEYTFENNRQSDKKFIFCSHDFSSNNVLLIHSNAIGEKTDPRWQYYIYRMDVDFITREMLSNYDNQTIPPSVSDFLTDLWKNPR